MACITVTKCITILKEQEEFIQNERATFNLSRFIQGKLDEYIKSMKEIRKFTEEIKNG